MAEDGSIPTGNCPFCGWGYSGRPNRCKLCGTVLNDAKEDVKRLATASRKAITSRKALADTFFLVGLLLGGPMTAFGDQLRFGLFIVLAGGLASVLRRYTNSSTPATVVLGCLGAMIAATTLVAPAAESPEEPAVAEAARAAYASALAEQDPDVFVDTRGLGQVAIWFTIPQGLSGECGEYPAPEVRAHLGDLGFRRIVVTIRNQSGGLCSFSP